jgi:hypothetical protein
MAAILDLLEGQLHPRAVLGFHDEQHRATSRQRSFATAAFASASTVGLTEATGADGTTSIKINGSIPCFLGRKNRPPCEE